MTSNLTLTTMPSDFKSALKEKILGAFIDLIPEEQFNEMLNEEIKAFFESEQIVAVTEGKMEVNNPKYNPTSNQIYGNTKTLTKECMTLSMKVSPFRQLVWSTLYSHLSEKIEEVVKSEHSQVGKSLAEWFETKAKGEIKETQSSMIERYAMAGGMGMLSSVLLNASLTSKATIMSALQQTGVDISRVSI